MPNTTRSNSNTSGSRSWLISLHRKRWYGLSSDAIPILSYISAISQTTATGYLLKRSRTSNKSCCNFGPWCMTSFSDTCWPFAEASKTILVLVVSFSGLITGKWGRSHLVLVLSSAPTFLMYPFSSYWLMMSQ